MTDVDILSVLFNPLSELIEGYLGVKIFDEPEEQECIYISNACFGKIGDPPLKKKFLELKAAAVDPDYKFEPHMWGGKKTLSAELLKIDEAIKIIYMMIIRMLESEKKVNEDQLTDLKQCGFVFEPATTSFIMINSSKLRQNPLLMNDYKAAKRLGFLTRVVKDKPIKPSKINDNTDDEKE